MALSDEHTDNNHSTEADIIRLLKGSDKGDTLESK